MTIMKHLLIGAGAAVLLSFTACSTKRLIDLDTVSTSEKINMKAGQTYTVKVKENPTTGYTWKTEGSENCPVSVADSQYEQDPNPTKMLGKGGVRTFVLKADKAGVCNMKFRYNLGGRAEGETIKELDITVK